MTEKELFAALKAFPGITSLNPMQQQAWGCRSAHICIISPTGSGKTLALGGALLRRLGAPGRGPRAIVLTPSRELTLQVADVLRRLGRGYKTAAFYGSHSMTDECGTLRGMPDIIVATPGRLLDHLQRGTLTPPERLLDVLAVDEYDKALELGFQDEMRRIVRRLGRPRNLIVTSATEGAVPDFIDMSEAEYISGAEAPAPDIEIFHVESPARDKLDTLYDLLRAIPSGKTIVFVNHRDAAERVASGLRDRGIPAGLYHGGLEQQEREEAVIQLDNGSKPVLVSTDLGSRGLDIGGVEAVVHYHLPVSEQAWTHRNGRTARAGASGSVYVITSEADDIPEYVRTDHEYFPGEPRPAGPKPPVTLYIDAGRREKISRADILGFLVKQAGLEPSEIGRIDLRDHRSYVAVPRTALPGVAAVKGVKMKNKKVRITPLK